MTRTTTETMLLEALEEIAKDTQGVWRWHEGRALLWVQEPTKAALTARRAIATAKGEDRT